MTRNVVVTGGGTGIGLAIAHWFAESGDDVWIVGRRPDVLATVESERIIGVAGDLSEPDGVRTVAEQLPDRIGVLVNNAGGNTDFDNDRAADDDPLEATTRSWRANLDANVLTAVLATTALRDRIDNPGRIINLSSIAARAGAGSYGAAKAAIDSWTVALAHELGQRAITVNSVAPGLIEQTEFFRGQLSDERRESLVEQTSTGRAGVPADIAATVGFLASAGASHITGQVIHVNGGALTH
ncbi:SDR family oxidoreductase [Epidermidibacterium keratini]|uniref:SDR family oxidoreductase n=1 Tax=Epidermidibacterium keratini TaxID=1891644 RepID=A0A7L4YPL9_9ACTN|nr:SDR family oxidoreductase [Epidermidibacterium keratini]QHC01225.1 SDR family oxidoreductase [Epidermidibacterium keratini]